MVPEALGTTSMNIAQGRELQMCMRYDLVYIASFWRISDWDTSALWEKPTHKRQIEL